MTWQEIISVIGVFFVQLIFICCAHLLAFFMDSSLYKSNKYNEKRRIVKVGCRWIFWRCKKDCSEEIFTIAYVHEIINICLLLGISAELTVSFILNLDIVYMFICTIIIFLYMCHCAIMEGIISKKL